jgi:hypothetical protein
MVVLVETLFALLFVEEIRLELANGSFSGAKKTCKHPC